MLLLRTEALPDGEDWIYELKLDGYRALAIRIGGKVKLRSRNDNDFSVRCPSMVKALSALPDETVIDGELVAFDPSGRPSFNMLQNASSGDRHLARLLEILDRLPRTGDPVAAAPHARSSSCPACSSRSFAAG